MACACSYRTQVSDQAEVCLTSFCSPISYAYLAVIFVKKEIVIFQWGAISKPLGATHGQNNSMSWWWRECDWHVKTAVPYDKSQCRGTAVDTFLVELMILWKNFLLKLSSTLVRHVVVELPHSLKWNITEAWCVACHLCLLWYYGEILFSVLLSYVQSDVAQVQNPLCIEVCLGFKDGSYAPLGNRKHEES